MADAEVHPSAVVDPRAQLGPGVGVGAFSVVGPEVVLGEGVEVGHHVVLEGRVSVGPGTRIGHGCVLGGRPQDLKYREGTPSGVRVGAGCDLREYVTVHRATQAGADTVIGDGCLLMATSHVAHDCRLGRGVILINYAGITGHCEIGDRATIGGLSGLAPFTRVGTFAYIGGVSKVTADVPPYLIATGIPATARAVNVVGLRRAGVAAADRRQLQEAYRLLYRSGLTPQRAVEAIRAAGLAGEVVATLLDFIAASRRGICPGPRHGERPGGEPSF